MDRCRVLRASINGVPATWKRPRGHPGQTCIRTVEDDLRPANIGLKTCDNYRVSGALEKLEHETILQDRASDR